VLRVHAIHAPRKVQRALQTKRAKEKTGVCASCRIATGDRAKICYNSALGNPDMRIILRRNR
jgi:sulfopyruvate decarboxylase TPP-binding subunit